MGSLTLKQIWEEQRAYNEKVREKRPLNYEGWMEKYLLGAISEVNEVLNEINWKAHRQGKPLNEVNLARELSDLTKYTLSLWEWSGFTHQDMLQYVHEKSMELEVQWEQDFEAELPPHSRILISDIDGTIADYRKGFYQWLLHNHLEKLPQDDGTNLAMEIDLGLSYPLYVQYKEEFESSGGYSELPLYPDVGSTFNSLHDMGIAILVYTARPSQTHSRIWNDTWGWLKTNLLTSYITELRIGKEQRIARACQLQSEGHQVVLLEDEPESAIRAASAGIQVLLRNQPYNVGIQHEKIIRFSKLRASQVEIYLTYFTQEGVES